MARWLRFLVAPALAGCGPGPADAPEGPASMEPEGTTGSNRSEPGPGEPTRPAEEDPMDEETSALSIRFEPARSTFPAGAEPQRSIEARLEGVLRVRNGSDAPVEIVAVIPAAFELEWRLLAADGTVWRPTFLPPPMPRPGGRPPRRFTLGPGAEELLTTLHGISGFFREGAEPSTFGPLPVGRYELVIGGVRLGEGPPLETAPVTLRVE